ncbi:MAG: hypothetical protein PWP16_39 [Eubacteriaceae bacterium]|nr:hypothetical protein [Eubacteriaceae bacterium]MDK2961525.1 hypothetical protein [Eubacteriaceae bacterium]MDN5306676.1 hypothetical protein [Eubacteriaceae bacterium]
MDLMAVAVVDVECEEILIMTIAFVQTVVKKLNISQECPVLWKNVLSVRRI